MIDVCKSREAQKKYCEENKVPNFAADGVCPMCLCDVFKVYTVEYSSKNLITACPKCRYSLCG